MSKTIAFTDKAPLPIGPYSQGVRVDNTWYFSGQIALDPVSGDLITSDIESETKQVMENIGAMLESQGLAFANIVKTSIFLKDMDNFSKVNAVYGSYFQSDFPARETVEVARLPKDVNVEISIIAVR